MNEWARRAGTVALALGCSPFGCSPSATPPGIVRGTITYKEQPLPRGFLHFYKGTNRVGIGVIKSDGSGVYEAAVVAGPVQVIVKGDPLPSGHIPRSLRGAALSAEQAKFSNQMKFPIDVQEKYG
jgi:hypothetical protein